MRCEMWAWRQAIDGYIGRMKEHLRIDLAELPEDGKWVSGELPKEIFDLPEGDAQAVGPAVRAVPRGAAILLRRGPWVRCHRAGARAGW